MKQVIYYWRSEKPISQDKPFMAFLDLAKEQSPGYLSFILLNVFILAAAWGLFRFFPTESAKEYVTRLLAATGAVGLLKMVWSSLEFVNKVTPYPDKVRRWLNDKFHSTK